MAKTQMIYKLDSSHICAGGKEGEGPCTGDGGGPLVCRAEGETDRFVQV